MPNRTFRGPDLLQIAMPMGGIGAGSVCLSGNGGLLDWSITHKPDFSAREDGAPNQRIAFALLHIKGDKPITKLVEGPLPMEKVFDQGLQSLGYRHMGHEGLPRFKTCEFEAEYPFGHVKLTHPNVPLDVKLTGFNPFIPLDDKHSGMPCAVLDYQLTNHSNKPVEFEFSFHLSHLVVAYDGYRATRNKSLPGFGVHLFNTEHPNHGDFGGAALGVIGHSPRIKEMWFRGGWFDWIGALWAEASEGRFVEDKADPDLNSPHMNGGSILLSGSLKPGESITYPIVIAWYAPNSHLAEGQSKEEREAYKASLEKSGDKNPPPRWRPFYAGKWKDAADVAKYAAEHYPSLKKRTRAFREALASTTADPAVIDAVGSNLAILKSPTVLRQENGSVWAWEGVFTTAGSCFGSCTHVWNYAQAMPHLYPALERTLREAELLRSMDERGHVTFRCALPDGPVPHDYHAAADGQLGGIMKVFRDWQISGDATWLKTIYPAAKRSIDFCIQLWDPDHRGALFEPHHNTYDIEFWGPDGMCTSVYLGALTAIAAMAKAMGDPAAAKGYEELAAKGAKFLDQELFNGEYFFQKVQWNELHDQSFVKSIADVNESSNAMQRLLKAEGPKYQYGLGCISDGVIGAWMAKIYGLHSPQNVANIRSTLKAIFKHNFKADLSEHACTQRPGYAINNEAGLILCTWPRGHRPTLPFVYSDEVWTGIEYQVASHLIEEGLVEEGLTIVKAVRSRYEGHVRNPFNEYECGSFYARALASYALLGSLSGFRYSAVDQELWFAPKVAGDYKTFFSTASGFGSISLAKGTITIDVVEGHLTVEKLHVAVGGKTYDVEWKTDVQPGKVATKAI